MRKLRKGRVMLIVLVALVIIAIAAILIISGVNKEKQPSEGEQEEVQQVIPLPETTYSDMEVRNISMEYMKNNDQTKISMEIDNVTQKKVEDEHFTAMLIGPNDEIIGQMPTWIQSLEAGDQYRIEVILEGDLTATKQIKLVEKE